MSTNRNKSFLSYVPGYSGNAVLRLIILCGVLYVMLGITWAIIMLIYNDAGNFNQYFIGNLALPHVADFKHHWWSLITYGWLQYPNGFLTLLSNMLWLYAFGSVVQMLIGPKQVVPIFFYGLLSGGVVYLLAQLMPGELGKCPPLMLGPRGGMMAMAAAAYTLTPKYRFWLSETFSIPMALAAGIFLLLMIIGTGFYIPVFLLLAGGALAGFGYIKLLRAGYRPGGWMTDIASKAESLVTPGEGTIYKNQTRRNEVLNSKYKPKSGISQQRIDDILDKINQKGYNSLSSEEKEILLRAGKDRE